MQAYENEIVDLNPSTKKKIKRRSLLPWWIRFFCWVFMIFGIFAPAGLIFGLLRWSFNLSIYGLESNQPLSVIGLSIILLFTFKAFTAFGLWSEKEWAVRVGQIDAVIGIVLCIFVMFVNPFLSSGANFTFRLELALLIPFLIKLTKIKEAWET